MYLSPINLEAGPKKGLPKHKPFSNAKLFRTMIGFIKPYRGKFILGSVLTLTGETSWLYQAYVLSAIVTFFASYKAGDPFDAFWEMTAIWVVLSLYRYIAVYYSKKIGFGIGEKIAIDAHLKTIRHLFRLDISWHEHENAGNKIKRISHGTEGLDKITRLWFVNVLNIVVGLGGTLFIISRVDGKISLAIGAFLVVYYVIARFCSQRASEASRIVNLKEENIYGLLFESVNNIRSVKVMSMIEPLYRVLVESSNDLFESIKKRVKWFQLSATVKNIWGQLFRIALTAYIAYGISQGQYEIGFLVLTYGYFGSIWQSISELSDLTQEFIISKFRISRMTEMLDEPVAIDEERGKVAFPKDWKRISIRNLSFSYGKKTVLNSISFDINRGERIGIIGLSGAGKSTILKMLLKEHEGYTGEILIDDVPLRDISKTDYFDHVAVVLQETEVFNFSLKDNITISNDKEAANTALLQKSADIAHVTEFVKGLSAGLDTQIGEKGIRLSGGEKQRVGIARAVFKNPQLLLLDEATSHLDIESEEKIRDSLHQFFQTVTAVVIAHRLTTIKEMDRILVIEDGKILESGNFEELYAKQGRFFELWEKQKL